MQLLSYQLKTILRKWIDFLFSLHFILFVWLLVIIVMKLMLREMHEFKLIRKLGKMFLIDWRIRNSSNNNVKSLEECVNNFILVLSSMKINVLWLILVVLLLLGYLRGLKIMLLVLDNLIMEVVIHIWIFMNLLLLNSIVLMVNFLPIFILSTIICLLIHSRIWFLMLFILILLVH